jgi:serine/threonine protein kinase
MKGSKMSGEEFLSDTNFNFGDYFSFKRVLGKGSFGYVVLAMSKSTLEVMAVKVISSFIIGH